MYIYKYVYTDHGPYVDVPITSKLRCADLTVALDGSADPGSLGLEAGPVRDRAVTKKLNSS